LAEADNASAASHPVVIGFVKAVWALIAVHLQLCIA
jgi:hypothetical protein